MSFRNLFCCHIGQVAERNFTGICWTGNFQLGRDEIPKGPHSWLLYSKGQILDHFLPFSPVCWQVNRRIKSLSCKPLTWGSIVAPCYSTERNREFKPKLTQRHGSTQFFFLSIRYRNLDSFFTCTSSSWISAAAISSILVFTPFKH